MVFSSVNFLFLFLPALIVSYFMIPRKYRQLRNNVLLLFSLFFYAYGGPKFLLVMLLSIAVNYCFGLLVNDAKTIGGRRGALAFAVVCNLLILGYYKYTMFFMRNINSIFGANFPIPEIVLPIGISFFTFQGLSYVLDIYQGTAQVQKNPLNVALYISLFPQLIAGPIVRYSTVAKEIHTRNENIDDFSYGIRRFILGLGKKILLANTTGLVADKIFGFQPNEMSVVLAWMGAVCYTLQIYFDFSGYSDMAIGLGKMFGFHFLENFNYPYISKSITEFWRRWHISLSSWFRDYVYIPLGGNRVPRLKFIRNMLAVWFLTGFWHGADWTFIFWGLYFAVILLAEKLVYGKYLEKCPSILRHGYALVLIMISWVFFRSASMGYALEYVKTMFGFGSVPLIDNKAIYYLMNYKVEIVFALIGSLPLKIIIPSLLEKMKAKKALEFVTTWGMDFYTLCILGLSIMFLINSTFNPFIYFRF